MSKHYWTTADDKHIPYKELSNEHLRNIIADGYRNDNILKEARRRKMKVPIRAIDKLSALDICVWIEALASSAIEGNDTADRLLKTKDKNFQLFLLDLNAYIEAYDDHTPT